MYLEEKMVYISGYEESQSSLSSVPSVVGIPEKQTIGILSNNIVVDALLRKSPFLTHLDNLF
jgi:hypothetical protein